MNDFLQSLRNNQAEKPRAPKARKNYDNSYQYSSGPRFNQYGGGYPNNRPHQMKRHPAPGMPPHQGHNQMPMDDPNTTFLADLVDNLSTQIDTLIKNQEYMITVQERTADLLQRQADAIELVMAHLNISPDMGLPEPAFEHHYVSSQEPEDEMDGTVEELLKAELKEEKLKKQASQARPVIRKRRKVISKPAAVKKTPPPSDAQLLPRDEIMDIINTMREDGATYDQVAKHLTDLGQPTFSGRGEWHAQTIHRLCSKK